MMKEDEESGEKKDKNTTKITSKEEKKAPLTYAGNKHPFDIMCVKTDSKQALEQLDFLALELESDLKNFTKSFKPIRPDPKFDFPVSEFYKKSALFVQIWCTSWLNTFKATSKALITQSLVTLEEKMILGDICNAYLRDLLVLKAKEECTKHLYVQILNYVIDDVYLHKLLYSKEKYENTYPVTFNVNAAEFSLVFKLHFTYSVTPIFFNDVQVTIEGGIHLKVYKIEKND